MHKNTALAYYAAQGLITDPGDRAALFDDLPADIGALCRLVQDLVLHVHWAERYGAKLSAQRQEELQLRFVAKQLKRIEEIDPGPLARARPLEKKLVGNCRDFSVLLAAMLRHRHVPARARCGFGRYFTPGHYEDHWVCEYWNQPQRRWMLTDAQLDEFQRQKLGIAFDPLDVPRDQFITGGRAWQLCRTGQADPEAFGIFAMHGLWFVRSNFIRDLAALNKIELLPWDNWGIMESADNDDRNNQFLDHLAELTGGDVPQFDSVRSRYETDTRIRVPAVIRSHTAAGVQRITLWC